MLERLGAFIRSFLLTAEHHHNPAFRVEFDHHVRTFVRNPDVVLGVDLYRMTEGPCVEVVADFANELAVGTELEQLRCSGSVSRPGRVATRQGKYVAFGIYGHAGHLSQVAVRGKL